MKVGSSVDVDVLRATRYARALTGPSSERHIQDQFTARQRHLADRFVPLD